MIPHRERLAAVFEKVTTTSWRYLTANVPDLDAHVASLQPVPTSPDKDHQMLPPELTEAFDARITATRALLTKLTNAATVAPLMTDDESVVGSAG